MPGLTLVVMAAGMGSRYGGLKQIDPVGPHGELILDYSVYDALGAGFERVVFLIRHEIEDAFRERVGRTVERRVDTVYVFQELDQVPAEWCCAPPGRKKPWGTGQAVLACRDAVSTPFAAINADDFYGAAAFRALAGHLRQARDRDGVHDYSMVGYQLGNTLSEHGQVARGICAVSAEGDLLEVRERMHIERRAGGVQYLDGGVNWVALPPDTIVSLNTWGFTPSIFAELEAGVCPVLAQQRRPLAHG